MVAAGVGAHKKGRLVVVIFLFFVCFLIFLAYVNNAAHSQSWSVWQTQVAR